MIQRLKRCIQPACNATAIWDINASGSWEHTTIACSLLTTSQTDLVYEAH